MDGAVAVCAIVSAAAGIAGGLLGGYLYSARKLGAVRAVISAILDGVVRERDLVRIRRKLASRPRRRYIVFEVIPQGLPEDEVRDAIRETAARLSGSLGLALSGMDLVYYDESTSRGILRVRREYKSLALAVLGLTRRIGSRKALIVPLATTGSVKRARRLVRPP